MSAEQKHTPGTWVVWSDEGDDDKGRALVSVCKDGDGDSHICVTTSRHIDYDTAWANAYLIAAAPDLLAAAELALTTIEGLERQAGHPSMDGGKLRAAISKAEGK